jgi:Ca2+-binding RTX toxin-like protein
VTVGVATPGAQAVVNAQAGTTVNITTANSNGNPQNLAGSVIQARDGSQGSFVVDYEGAVIGGTKVSGSINLGGDRGGVGTIADNAPPGTFNGTPDTYIQTGAGNDSIQGSEGIDFIRAGAGNDVINAGAGNDIVRPGSGNDLITLGKGNDVVYLTVDQLQGIQTKTISDFSTSGADKIQIASHLKGLVSISGQGTKQIVITLSGAQSGTTTVVSNGQVIKGDDIQFV